MGGSVPCYQFLTPPNPEPGPLEARRLIFKLMRFEIVNVKLPFLFFTLNIVLASLANKRDQCILIFKMKAEVFL